MTHYAQQSNTSRRPVEVASSEAIGHNPAVLRSDVKQTDANAVRIIAQSTDFFSEEEIEVAVELIRDRIDQGEKSDYQFIFADVNESAIGFASFGRIPCTVGSFDLYWIAVHRDHQNAGIGRQLLAEAERIMKAADGLRVYVETSSREQYAPTRRFYESCGYAVDAVQHDFYASGDGKVTLVKVL